MVTNGGRELCNKVIDWYSKKLVQRIAWPSFNFCLVSSILTNGLLPWF